MNVIIIHGSYGKPFENWFPWLENELSANKIECFVPTFPTPVNQEYLCWKELLDYYRKINRINSDTIIIGHSCGAIFAARYLVENEISVKALISISGYNNFYAGDKMMDKLNGSFYTNDTELASIKALVNTRLSFISENDPFIPIDYLRHFSEIINSDLISIPNGGHFNSTAGYNTFPELLFEVKKMC